MVTIYLFMDLDSTNEPTQIRIGIFALNSWFQLLKLIVVSKIAGYNWSAENLKLKLVIQLNVWKGTRF